jgi:hypothetical protein
MKPYFAFQYMRQVWAQQAPPTNVQKCVQQSIGVKYSRHTCKLLLYFDSNLLRVETPLPLIYAASAPRRTWASNVAFP